MNYMEFDEAVMLLAKDIADNSWMYSDEYYNKLKDALLTISRYTRMVAKRHNDLADAYNKIFDTLKKCNHTDDLVDCYNTIVGIMREFDASRKRLKEEE